MDFITFKFMFDDRGKELLIRRDDVTLGYLRLMTRKVFKFTERKKFALSFEVVKHGHQSESPKNRHNFCCQPRLRPDKLLTSDRQLVKLRRAIRKKHSNTMVILYVHTEPAVIKKYYDETSRFDLGQQ
jgi:hypothetical protein